MSDRHRLKKRIRDYFPIPGSWRENGIPFRVKVLVPVAFIILAMAAFFVISIASKKDAVNATDQRDAAQSTLQQVADPLAALCAADPAIKARVGEACGVAASVVATPAPVPVPGAPGADGRGIRGTAISASGNLVITYTDGTTQDAGRVMGTPGLTGVGISGSTIAGGRLILSFSNGTTQDVGQVVGATGIPGNAGEPGRDGSDGIGISKVEASPEGRLLVTYTNGSTVDVGPLPQGPKGDQGIPGPTCPDGSAAQDLLIQGFDADGFPLPDKTPVKICVVG